MSPWDSLRYAYEVEGFARSAGFDVSYLGCSPRGKRLCRPSTSECVNRSALWSLLVVSGGCGSVGRRRLDRVGRVCPSVVGATSHASRT